MLATVFTIFQKNIQNFILFIAEMLESKHCDEQHMNEWTTNKRNYGLLAAHLYHISDPEAFKSKIPQWFSVAMIDQSLGQLVELDYCLLVK